MKKITLIVLTTILLTLLMACVPFNETTKGSTNILFDVNGGLWQKDELLSTKADATVVISKFDDSTGSNTDFTLFKPTDTGLRWYYKLFIQYYSDLDTYIVVATDAYTASVDRLNLVDYDFIIGVHYHNS